MVGAEHRAVKFSSPRQVITTRTLLPPTMHASLTIDATSITHPALSTKFDGIFSGTRRISSITTPQFSSRAVSFVPATLVAAELSSMSARTKDRCFRIGVLLGDAGFHDIRRHDQMQSADQ